MMKTVLLLLLITFTVKCLAEVVQNNDCVNEVDDGFLINILTEKILAALSALTTNLEKFIKICAILSVQLGGLDGLGGLGELTNEFNIIPGTGLAENDITGLVSSNVANFGDLTANPTVNAGGQLTNIAAQNIKAAEYWNNQLKNAAANSNPSNLNNDASIFGQVGPLFDNAGVGGQIGNPNAGVGFQRTFDFPNVLGPVDNSFSNVISLGSFPKMASQGINSAVTQGNKLINTAIKTGAQLGSAAANIAGQGINAIINPGSLFGNIAANIASQKPNAASNTGSQLAENAVKMVAGTVKTATNTGANIAKSVKAPIAGTSFLTGAFAPFNLKFSGSGK